MQKRQVGALSGEPLRLIGRPAFGDRRTLPLPKTCPAFCEEVPSDL